MIVGLLKETFENENRVALVPQALPGMTKAGMDVLMEAGAGAAAGYPDAAYTEKGATIAADRDEVFAKADVLVQVRTAGANPSRMGDDLGRYRPGQVVIGFAEPLAEAEKAKELGERGVMLFSMEMVPRITRAQSMDALSSQASLAGFKAVILAAHALQKIFPMMMTAAGTITPAKVFVIGAGVAGLQAIATAKRLGAAVSATDVRPAVKEQVESLGGQFVFLEEIMAEGQGGYAKELTDEQKRKQQELIAKTVAESDVVITTAAIPGRRSPVLVTAEMVKNMPPGAVIVDLAAERGGNCELTQGGQTVQAHGVTILGPQNVPALVAYHASQTYSKNITTFLTHLVKDGQVVIDTTDEITADTLITRDGEVVQPRVRQILNLPELAPPAAEPANGPIKMEGEEPAQDAGGQDEQLKEGQS